MSRSSLTSGPNLSAGQPLVGCNSLSTALEPVGGDPVEALNLNNRQVVEAAHRAAIQAGAQFIQTNTFGANRIQLAPYGWQDRVWDLNVWGAKVARDAREVVGEPVLVAGTIGPLTPLQGEDHQLFGQLDAQTMAAAYDEQVAALLAGGVDFFLIETQADAYEASAAVNAVRQASHLPVAVTFSFAEGNCTLAGQSVANIVDIITNQCSAPPDYLGPGCAPGPRQALRIVNELRQAGWDGELCATPDAGPVGRSGSQHFYVSSPEYFAQQSAALFDEGVVLLAGCCGTTPHYTQAVAATFSQSQGEKALLQAGGAVITFGGGAAGGYSTAGVLPESPEPVASAVTAATTRAGEAQSRFLQKLNTGFGISVELDPPRGTNARKFIQDAGLLAAAGVDAINVGDSPMARVRMGALTASYLIQQETGVETILHFTTRDRNLMAIQADLLSAHTLGIRNVLALTGDHPRLGNTKASPVYDIDSIGLLEVLHGLNGGQDINGNDIGQGTTFTKACALSPYADDFELELERFRAKLANGAQFVMTQPLYETEPFHRVLERLGGAPVPVVLGVMPLHSGRHAHYLHNEVPGISIPKPIREVLDGAGDRGLEVGLELAAETVSELRPYISGVYVVASFGQIEPVAEFVQKLRKEWG